MTRDDARALILSFPGAHDAVSYGAPSFHVAGKFFTWFWPRADTDSLVIHLDNLDERDLLIEADPTTLFTTDHHRDYPMVLARVATVDPAWLRARLEHRWRRVAPKRLVRAHDAERAESGTDGA